MAESTIISTEYNKTTDNIRYVGSNFDVVVRNELELVIPIKIRHIAIPYILDESGLLTDIVLLVSDRRIPARPIQIFFDLEKCDGVSSIHDWFLEKYGISIDMEDSELWTYLGTFETEDYISESIPIVAVNVTGLIDQELYYDEGVRPFPIGELSLSNNPIILAMLLKLYTHFYQSNTL